MSKCTCSLNLGIYYFRSSKDEEVLKLKFPNLVDFLEKKTDESYFSLDCPKFHFFPPAVLPDENLPHGFPSTFQEKNEEKLKWFKKFEAVHAEQVVAHSFISFFSKNKDYEGFLFARDFHTDTYLENEKQRAKQQRKENAKRNGCDVSCSPLSSLELNIGDSIGAELTNYFQHISNLTEEELDEILEQDELRIKNDIERKRFEAWRKMNLQTCDAKRNYISCKHYQTAVNARNFEVDMVLVLADFKAIVQIEVKSISDIISLANVLKKASGQLQKVNKTFEGLYQNILGKDWKFVRVIAIPKIDKITVGNDSFCEHCANFIMGSQEISGSYLWIQKLLDLVRITSDSRVAYKKLFARIVGFYSCSENHGVSVNLSLPQTRLKSEKSVTGRAHGVSSEETMMNDSMPDNLENLSLKDLKQSKKKGGHLPLSSALVMTYWNPCQLAFLLEREEKKMRVFFNSDFGCGKTLLLKYFAKMLSKRKLQNGQKQEINFLSLASAKGQELHEMTGESQSLIKCYRQPSVIDVANTIDFAGTDVKVSVF